MSNQLYAVKLTMEPDEEIKEIQTFVSEGTPVIIVNELDDLHDLGFDPRDVLIVERE